MPRIVNHDQRRAELAEAVWQVIREDGLRSVSLRRITEASGWSSGAIRHYLPNREAILTFAAQHVMERAEARMRAVPLSEDRRGHFLALLSVMLPLDDETRVWMEVWLAFVGASVGDPGLTQTQGLLYGDLNAFIGQCLEDFERRGWLPDHTPQAAATELHALLDGLSLHLLLRQITSEQARAALASALDGLLRPPA